MAFLVYLMLVLCFVSVTAAEETHTALLYRQFFPAWNDMLNGYLRHECNESIANYYNVTYPDAGASYTVLNCLLEQFPEFRKAELSAAAVVLGLAPTILQMISPTPAETALVAVRRPLLALLLCLAAPVTAFSQASDYSPGEGSSKDPLLSQVRKRLRPKSTPMLQTNHCISSALLTMVQYALALASVANSAYRTYQLCIWTVCTFAPTIVFLPALWHGSVLLLQLSGWVALRLCVRQPPNAMGEPAVSIKHNGKLRASFKSETTPAIFANELSMKNRAAGPAPFFYILLTASYVGVPVHILYGTLVLSSLTFISAFDAITVVAWYALSTVISKAITYSEQTSTDVVGDDA